MTSSHYKFSWILLVFDLAAALQPEALMTHDVSVSNVSGSKHSRDAIARSQTTADVTEVGFTVDIALRSRQATNSARNNNNNSNSSSTSNSSKQTVTFTTQKRAKVARTPTPTQQTAPLARSDVKWVDWSELSSRLTQTDTSVVTADTSQFTVVVDGPQLQVELEDEYVQRRINCWFHAGSRARGRHLEAEVVSNQPRVVSPYPVGWHNRTVKPLHDPTQSRLRLRLNCSDNPTLLGVYTRTVGRADLELRVRSDSQQHTDTTYIMSWAVVRQVRVADMTFDCVIPVVTLIVCFSMGCASDLSIMRTHVTSLAASGVAICCQFFLLPVVSDFL